MKLTAKITITTLVSLFMATTVYAHSLWVNSFESFAHKPGHITVGLGWGHTLPIDDLLNSENGKTTVESFSITDPNGNQTALKIPSSEVATAQIETKSFDIYNSDVGLQKIALKEDSPKGVYKIEAKSKPTFYTVFIDEKDRNRLKLKSIDQLKGIKKVLLSIKWHPSFDTKSSLHF